jgi:hypothetical protein
VALVGALATIGGATAGPARAWGASATSPPVLGSSFSAALLPPVVSGGPRAGGGAPSPLGYLSVDLEPGGSVVSGVVVQNFATAPAVFDLEAARGVTATNSGDAYVPLRSPGPCGAACWLVGLPSSIEVPAGGSTRVGFALEVPASAPPGDYLAGILVRPAAPPASGPSVRHGAVGAEVQVVRQVALGVAVTVGNPLALADRLAVPSVSVGVGPGGEQLSVIERDVGQTWVHPRGVAWVRVGQHIVSLSVVSGTVLPGDQATLAVHVAGVPVGSWPVVVRLCDTKTTACAEWSGTLRFRPSPPAPNPRAHELDGKRGEAQAAWWLLPVVAFAAGGLGLLARRLRTARRLRGTALPGWARATLARFAVARSAHRLRRTGQDRREAPGSDCEASPSSGILEQRAVSSTVGVPGEGTKAEVTGGEQAS